MPSCKYLSHVTQPVSLPSVCSNSAFSCLAFWASLCKPSTGCICPLLCLQVEHSCGFFSPPHFCYTLPHLSFSIRCPTPYCHKLWAGTLQPLPSCSSAPPACFSDKLLAYHSKNQKELSVPLLSLIVPSISMQYFSILQPCCTVQYCPDRDCTAVLQYLFITAVWSSSSSRVEHCRARVLHSLARKFQKHIAWLVCVHVQGAGWGLLVWIHTDPFLPALQNGLGYHQQPPSLLLWGSSWSGVCS